jgi:hypothetical protein
MATDGPRMRLLLRLPDIVLCVVWKKDGVRGIWVVVD